MSKAIPLIFLLLLTGCGPRWETAKKQVLTKIEHPLGRDRPQVATGDRLRRRTGDRSRPTEPCPESMSKSATRGSPKT